jgi:hypothetical protein
MTKMIWDILRCPVGTDVVLKDEWYRGHVSTRALNNSF